jgi:hypothetical protein
MNLRKSKWADAILACILAGTFLFYLPMHWVESQFGYSPDGGNGAFEYLLAATLLLAGAGLTVRLVLRRRQARRAGGKALALTNTAIT